jgi:hypothetical protein
VFAQDLVVNRPVGEHSVGLPLPRRVFERPEQGAIRLLTMAGGYQVGVDPLQRQRVGRHVDVLWVFKG